MEMSERDVDTDQRETGIATIAILAEEFKTTRAISSPFQGKERDYASVSKKSS